MQRITIVIGLILLTSFLVGCGETVHGVGKDVSRVGQGIHKIFIRDSSK